MGDVNGFLKTNQAARRIQLESIIVLHRAELSPRDILSLGESGRYVLDTEANEGYELQIGESVVALGEIVEDEGEYYFEISEVVENPPENREVL
ncbi:MAG: hypothetical protein CMN78_03430 [Spirochaetales bacterium]|nr:hypothetical protein [Spirochaetales bacterium]